MPTVALVACMPDIEELIAEALRDDGILVHSLALHGDTVSVLSKIRLDAVLVDGHPFTDLSVFLKALRAEDGTKDLPAIVVTAGRRASLDNLGWVEQLEMPFDLVALLDAMRRAIARVPRSLDR